MLTTQLQFMMLLPTVTLVNAHACHSVKLPWQMVDVNDADVLQYLLMAECDPNPCENNTSAPSPLHFAAAGKHMDCAQLLIDAGANINAVLVSAEVCLWWTNLLEFFSVCSHCPPFNRVLFFLL